jgi:membrane protein DedA with SNARE-associated domain/rhodanese-related sulfurtransferase
VNDHSDFLIHHGYALFFAWILVEQLGLPIPAIPLLLAAGALARTHQLNAAVELTLAMTAALSADVLWFEVGRRKGVGALHFLCRISLEQDSCVRETQAFFAKHEERALLAAKFLPGLDLMAPPIAGIVGMPLPRFVAFDASGAALYFGALLALGWMFSGQLERAAEVVLRLGAGALALLLAAEAGWLAWKFIRRRRFLRQLRIDRITPQDLKRKLDEGENVLIVDLRGPVEFKADSAVIPGAIRVDAGELEEMRDELANASEVVLYCSCPNEESSARNALLLKRKGVLKIRPLLKGLQGWRELGYPVAQSTARP